LALTGFQTTQFCTISLHLEINKNLSPEDTQHVHVFNIKMWIFYLHVLPWMSGIAKVDHTGNVRVLKTFFMPGPKMHLLNSYPKVSEVYMYLWNEKCFFYMYALSLLQKVPSINCRSHFLSKMHLRRLHVSNTLVNVTLCSPQFCQTCSCIFFQSLLHFKNVSPLLEGLL